MDAALYMNRGQVHVKLDPADGEALAKRHGLHVAGINGQTAYVKVTAAQAGVADLQAPLHAAVKRALERELKAPEGSAGSTGDFCLETGLAFPVTGWCDVCEQFCG